MNARASSAVRGALGCAVFPGGGHVPCGRVAAVFARAAHLDFAGVFVTLGDLSLPRHPFSILVPCFPAALGPGQKAYLGRGRLELEGGPSFELGRMRRFFPARRVARAAAPAILAALAASRRAAKESPDRGGLSALSQDSPDLSQSKGPQELILARAARLSGELVRAALRRDLDALIRAASDMAGLGQGLTPSGDDFLAGMFAALRFAALSGRLVLEAAAIERAAAEASKRTSPFSGFLLRAAARGLVAEPVSRWLCAVFSGRPGLAAEACREVLALGSSSGADVLAGLSAGLTTVMEAA